MGLTADGGEQNLIIFHRLFTSYNFKHIQKVNSRE